MNYLNAQLLPSNLKLYGYIEIGFLTEQSYTHRAYRRAA